MATYEDCGHWSLPLADPGPCHVCEREAAGDSRGPLASFAGGRTQWRDGQTTNEIMRENIAHWKRDGIDAQPVDRNRWI